MSRKLRSDPGWIVVTDSNEYVREVLEVRDVPTRALNLRESSVTDDAVPAWAYALALAEVFDRFDPNGRKAFKWAAVWRCALADQLWQQASMTISVLGEEDASSAAFLRQWVDNWLYKNNGVRCYPAELVEGAVLSRINVVK